MNNKSTKKRIIALAFLVCFLAAVILSTAFILTHADHEHDHNGAKGSCTICAQIQSAENLIKQFSTAFLGVLFAIAGLYTFVRTLKVISVYVSLSNPITQKIRINS